MGESTLRSTEGKVKVKLSLVHAFAMKMYGVVEV
jgi:hypothetical protein